MSYTRPKVNWDEHNGKYMPLSRGEQKSYAPYRRDGNAGRDARRGGSENGVERSQSAREPQTETRASTGGRGNGAVERDGRRPPKEPRDGEAEKEMFTPDPGAHFVSLEHAKVVLGHTKKGYPVFLLYNHKGDPPIRMSKTEINTLLKMLPKFQENAKIEKKYIYDAIERNAELTMKNLPEIDICDGTVEKKQVKTWQDKEKEKTFEYCLYTHVYEREIYLWLKLFWWFNTEPDDILHGRGGIMFSPEEDLTDVQLFVNRG